MRKTVMVLLVSCLMLPLLAYATWQVADPFHGTRLNRELQPAATEEQSDIPVKYQTESEFTFYTKKGWLKDNLISMAKSKGWQVKWKAFQNYHVLTESEISGESFQDAVQKLLNHYPIKGYYNNQLRVMTVVDTQQSKYRYK